jgi:hypothetical protein
MGGGAAAECHFIFLVGCPTGRKGGAQLEGRGLVGTVRTAGHTTTTRWFILMRLSPKGKSIHRVFLGSWHSVPYIQFKLLIALRQAHISKIMYLC